MKGQTEPIKFPYNTDRTRFLYAGIEPIICSSLLQIFHSIYRNKHLDSNLKGDLMLSEETIAKLKRHGFRRWTKNGKDRLYIDPPYLGLKCLYYYNGNICSAYLDGEYLEQKEAGRLMATKTYIDVCTEEIFSEDERLLKAAKELYGKVMGPE